MIVNAISGKPRADFILLGRFYGRFHRKPRVVSIIASIDSSRSISIDEGCGRTDPGDEYRNSRKLQAAETTEITEEEETEETAEWLERMVKMLYLPSRVRYALASNSLIIKIILPGR